VVLKTRTRIVAQLVEVPTGFCDPDDGKIKLIALDQRLQSRKYLLVSEITGSTEKYQGIRNSLADIILLLDESSLPACVGIAPSRA
jgi:hypothetical protein